MGFDLCNRHRSMHSHSWCKVKGTGSPAGTRSAADSQRSSPRSTLGRIALRPACMDGGRRGDRVPSSSHAHKVRFAGSFVLTRNLYLDPSAWQNGCLPNLAAELLLASTHRERRGQEIRWRLWRSVCVCVNHDALW